MISPKRIQGVFLRYSYSLIKGPTQLSDLLYWPLVDIFLWGLTSLWVVSQHVNPHVPLMLMTGLVFWQITWRGSIDVSISLLQEFWHRNLINFFSTSLRLVEWVLGIFLLSLCKFVITATFGVLAVYILYNLNVFAVGWIFLPFAGILLLFGWTLGLFASGIILYWGHRIETIAWMIGYLFAPFSAVFYPVAILPLWAKKIAWILPTTYIFEAMRALLSGQAVPSGFLSRSFALVLLYFVMSAFFLRWMFHKSRRKGLARLE